MILTLNYINKPVSMNGLEKRIKINFYLSTSTPASNALVTYVMKCMVAALSLKRNYV